MPSWLGAGGMYQQVACCGSLEQHHTFAFNQWLPLKKICREENSVPQEIRREMPRWLWLIWG